MIIKVQSLLGSPGSFSWGSSITLCAGSDVQGPEEWALNDDPLTEVVPVLGASFQTIIDRGNRLHDISFKVTNQQADVITAQARSLLLSATLPARGLISFQPDTWQGSIGTIYYAIGSVKFSLTQIGLSTIETYSIQCGQITTTIPAASP
jgi:hypothetical protein